MMTTMDSSVLFQRRERKKGTMLKILLLSMLLSVALAGQFNASTKCLLAKEWAHGHDGGYNGLCLEFCKMSWNSVNINADYLDAPSAADAANIASGHKPYNQGTNWRPWDPSSLPEPGAVVLFHDCNAPTNPYGHCCIASGPNNCISSGGVGAKPWSWYKSDYCGADPSGWIEPDWCF